MKTIIQIIITMTITTIITKIQGNITIHTTTKGIITVQKITTKKSEKMQLTKIQTTKIQPRINKTKNLQKIKTRIQITKM